MAPFSKQVLSFSYLQFCPNFMFWVYLWKLNWAAYTNWIGMHFCLLKISAIGYCISVTPKQIVLKASATEVYDHSTL